jgi:MerR family transcriptional regulator/heat shock protein HspR
MAILDIGFIIFYDNKVMKYQDSDPLFTISVAGQLTNLHPRTLMLYEKAGLVKPFRTKTDRRHYSQANLDKIKFIHYLTQEKRVNLAGIKILFKILKLAGKRASKIKSELFSDFEA